MSTEAQRIGATLRALREARGLSVDELATSIGVSRPQMSNIEAGRKNLSYRHLPRVAEVLLVPPIAIMRPELARDFDPHTPTNRAGHPMKVGA